MADDITRMAARLMDMLTPTVRAHRWNDCATCDVRHRMLRPRLGRSFRAFARSKDGGV